MKRLIVFVLGAMLLLTMSACDDQNNWEESSYSINCSDDLKPAKPVYELVDLCSQYPELFDLDTMKGLWVYVGTMGAADSLCDRFTLLQGKNYGYTDAALMDVPFVSLDEMRLVLSTYDTKSIAFSLCAYQNASYGFHWLYTDEEMADIARQLGIPDANVVYILHESDALNPLDSSAYQTAYVGYDDSGYLAKHALNEEWFPMSSVAAVPLFQMENRAELEQFMVDVGSYINMNATYDEVPSFTQVTASMDDAFFEQYTLFVVSMDAYSGSLRYGIREVKIEDGILFIIVEQLNHPEIVTCDMVGWLLTVPVEKAKLDGITGLTAFMDLGSL